MKVYYGCDRRALAEVIEFPMVSFRSLQKRKSGIILEKGKEWFMDSGAFTFLKQKGGFPYTYGEYLKAVYKFEPTYFANMDYCCEPTIVKATGLSVLHHIAKTIENGRQLIDYDKKRFVMVVQGWTARDYLTSLDYIKDYGLFTDILGIGTICGRTNPKEVYKIVKLIRYHTPDWVKLHAFGMSINLLKYKEIFDQLNSIDTYAWAFDFGINPFSKKLAKEALKKYNKKVNCIINKNHKQHILKLEGD